MPSEYLQNPTKEEARFIHESQWLVGMSKSPGWTLLKQRMAEMVANCRDICDNCESSDEKVIAGLHIRLKLTRSITRDIINWVESTEARRASLIEELTEPDPLAMLAQRGDEFKEENDESTAYA